MTPKEFAIMLLERMGYPISDNNIVAVVAWEAGEGGHWNTHPSTSYNPLNTSQPMPGSHPVIGSIQAYTTWAQGIEATARTLMTNTIYGMPTGYGAIREALSASADPRITTTAIATSKWGTTLLLGKDPYALAKGYDGSVREPAQPTGVAGVGFGLAGLVALFGAAYFGFRK